MKKYILFSGLLSLLLLTACGNNEEKAEPVPLPAQTESEESAPAEEVVNESNDVDFKEMISDNMRESDKLTKFSNKGNEIKATINLAESQFLSKKDLAESAYSAIGEILLGVEDWRVLTINFEDVGEVSFNRDEAEKNENGSFFPTAEIAKRLGNI
ncbi:hypothetical protein [Rummeliibacillus stabekisii]|uniref:hypothetical protein n=1 Tax=Rummeliibacillus stabekisii TaxID=241244 RepID=UPI0011692672|nr:hypothetical protein [Rummeliibacillus stabekisii]MBB5171638.1 hypothetical protein [Rummeliibacillus stabekisii]GEL05485.1 hypothetical protein RST01_21120 [Rummeliibacillus stabekisii]